MYNVHGLETSCVTYPPEITLRTSVPYTVPTITKTVKNVPCIINGLF